MAIKRLRTNKNVGVSLDFKLDEDKNTLTIYDDTGTKFNWLEVPLSGGSGTIPTLDQVLTSGNVSQNVIELNTGTSAHQVSIGKGIFEIVNGPQTLTLTPSLSLDNTTRNQWRQTLGITDGVSMLNSMTGSVSVSNKDETISIVNDTTNNTILVNLDTNWMEHYSVLLGLETDTTHLGLWDEPSGSTLPFLSRTNSDATIPNQILVDIENYTPLAFNSIATKEYVESIIQEAQIQVASTNANITLQTNECRFSKIGNIYSLLFKATLTGGIAPNQEIITFSEDIFTSTISGWYHPMCYVSQLNPSASKIVFISNSNARQVVAGTQLSTDGSNPTELCFILTYIRKVS